MEPAATAAPQVPSSVDGGASRHRKDLLTHHGHKKHHGRHAHKRHHHRRHEDDDDDDDDNYDDDEDEPPLVYLPMDSSTDACQCEVCPKEGKPPASTSSEESSDMIAKKPTSTTTPQNRIGVPGQCIICFEHFEQGDKVVWSETPSSCQHVYHEDCMVHYLASHSMRTKQLVYPNDDENNQNHQTGSYSENPCPTCRQRFCTISREDLILAVLLKSVQVALLEEDEEQQQQPQQSLSSSGAESSQGQAPTERDDVEIGISLGGDAGNEDEENDRGERIATVTSLALASVTIRNGGSLAATVEISTPSLENDSHESGDDSNSDTSNTDENNSTTQ